MNTRQSLLVLATLVGFTTSTTAADLTQIDRTIAKEPAYTSGSPKYCLFVFGPEAKTHVWVVLDGDNVYVDRNGNGDLTEANEKFEKPKNGLAGKLNMADIPSRNGKTKYSLEMSFYNGDSVVLTVLTNGKFRQMGGSDADGKLEFALKAKDAAVVHFDGPLMMNAAYKTAIHVGKKGKLMAVIGTPGLGKGSFASISFLNVPKDLHPVAEVEFPGAGPDGSPLKEKVVFDNRCWGNRFNGPVRVPDEAVAGKAKVHLSLPAWKERTVAPATVEIPVEKAPAVEKPEPMPKPEPAKPKPGKE